MGHFGKKDPKLTEVKAVLQRLQGFPEDEKPEAGTGHTSEGASPDVPSRAATFAVISATVVALAAGVAGAALFVAFSQNDPPPSVKRAEPTGPRVKAALEVARGLMAKGQVRAARIRLLALAEQGSPDAAWDLARSYDPNVLAKTQEADAAADIEEATRWYRTWYKAAVEKGLVAASVPLERIIGSMRNSPAETAPSARAVAPEPSAGKPSPQD